jgi:hypothetical protein
LGGKIQIDKILDEKIPIGIDDKSLIRKFDSIYLQNRCDLEIFFDSADKLYLLICISIEIDGRTLESDLFSFFGS